MTVNKILEGIFSDFKEYKDLEFKISNKAKEINTGVFFAEDAKELEDTKRFVSWQITESIEKLQKLSVKENFFFYDCAFSVYKKNYQNYLDDFISQNVDVEESDFIKKELSLRLRPEEERILFFNKNTIFYNPFIETDNNLGHSENKKREYLEYKLNQLGWDAYVINDKDGMPLHYTFEKNLKYKSSFMESVETDKMNAKNLAETIAKRIYKFVEYEEKEAEIIRRKKESFGAVNYSKEEERKLTKDSENLEKEIVEEQTEIKELLKQLYYKSAEDNFYFFDCPKIVYENTLQERYSNYRQKFLDANYKDFLQSEISRFDTPHKNRLLVFNKQEVNYSPYIGYSDEIFRMSNEKKVKFLKKEIDLLNKPPKKEEKKQIQKVIAPEEIVEKKTEKQLTSNQIVLLLDKVGFFANQKIENTSKVKQAELISKISGLHPKNIKKKIQNLDKSLKELGDRHQKDIDKIDAILDKLE